jgi:thiol-disulfide isomerase/thioredoxin
MATLSLKSLLNVQNLIMVAVFAIGISLVIFWANGQRKVHEGFADSDKKYKFVMYGVDWCPHCVSAKPEFAKLGSTKTIGGKVFEFQLVNPESAEGKVFAEGKDIRGFPTFHLYDSEGHLVKEYEGGRTQAEMEACLKTV